MSNTDIALNGPPDASRPGLGPREQNWRDYVEKGYENVVEDLVEPERCDPIDEDILHRYFGSFEAGYVEKWMYRMIRSKRPLEEKMALFWHHVFATGVGEKISTFSPLLARFDTFRRVGLSNMREILIELSKDPAMIFWLDNNENRKGEPNENYGRELLELFSMGVGNYTEDDIKNCARAFYGMDVRPAAASVSTGFLRCEIRFPSKKTTTMGKRLFWDIRAISTATILSTLSSNNLPAPSSYPGISTTFLSQTSRRFHPGM